MPFTTVKALYPRAHIEVSAHPQKAIEYCQKEDTRIDGPWERGDKPAQGKRTDIEECVQSIKDNLGQKRPMKDAMKNHTNVMVKFSRGIQFVVNNLVEPRCLDEMPKVTVFYGKTGTGKTRKAMAELPNAYVWDASKGSWLDGYLGHTSMIIEEFRGQMPFGQLLRLLDRYELQWPIKGGFVEVVASEFIITSPTHPREWYQDLEQRVEGSHDQLMRRITSIECLDPPVVPAMFNRS